MSQTTKTVQAIFSLHLATSGLAFILLVASALLLARQFAGGPGRPSFMRKAFGAIRKKHSSLGTHLFLMSALSSLIIAYAAQSAIVVLQVMVDSPVDITSAYAYQAHLAQPVNSFGTSQGRMISILSFVYQLASILTNFSIIGAIWLHANHMEENATGLKCPGFISWIWNLFWLAAVLGLGVASWALGMQRRGNHNEAYSYSSLVHTDFMVRTLYVAYIAVVITASTSATLEAVLCWIGTKKNGLTTESHARSTLSRFVFLVVPVVWARNGFSIAQAVVIYKNAASWSANTNRAVAFLFIIFGELAQLAILFLVLYAAWSYGRKPVDTHVATKEARDSDSYYAREEMRVV
ncbi:hypothetical protein P153DRAFT_377826 [Dothidotthia symphoricarpi CBS 119687]|uniref:Uncharacterized protein n=1 Tax=Dothidotthia symphoricarpi CBS 119687 TaxID=1392245 RepID=A0A6A6A4R5_9PLEO|nr:uncharacterized protein P153DRAFT_377826 [Dothidotthia symphoricarpi CBS 119687]KAF2126889.1 hypothetical protein P153DRAFT_377826 [Dothidotthia symphoricarpi CBS 119687]